MLQGNRFTSDVFLWESENLSSHLLLFLHTPGYPTPFLAVPYIFTVYHHTLLLIIFNSRRLKKEETYSPTQHINSNAKPVVKTIDFCRFYGLLPFNFISSIKFDVQVGLKVK